MKWADDKLKREAWRRTFSVVREVPLRPCQFHAVPENSTDEQAISYLVDVLCASHAVAPIKSESALDVFKRWTECYRDFTTTQDMRSLIYVCTGLPSSPITPRSPRTVYASYSTFLDLRSLLSPTAVENLLLLIKYLEDLSTEDIVRVLGTITLACEARIIHRNLLQRRL